jgi:energy-coupling factor transport system permease protein
VKVADPTRLSVRQPLHPLLSLTISVAVICFGLLFSGLQSKAAVLVGSGLLYLLFGYHRPWWFVFPFAFAAAVVVAGISYLAARDAASSVRTFLIILILGHGSVPVLAINPLDLSRVLVQAGAPRSFSLGLLVAVRFIPVLRNEVSRIREAITTRGIRFRWTNAGHLYRALLIPFVARLIDLSDTLALSMETRGYSAQTNPTVYKPVRWKLRDFGASFALCLVIGGVGVYRMMMNG